MVGVMLIIFILLPETPWWLAGKGKLDKAAKVLLGYSGHIEGYNVEEKIVRSWLPFTIQYFLLRIMLTLFTEYHDCYYQRGARTC
jgi:hypothetical protein